MNNSNDAGGGPTDNFIRSNTIKIPAVLTLHGTNAVSMVAGLITDPVRIPVRIEQGHSPQTGLAASAEPMGDPIGDPGPVEASPVSSSEPSAGVGDLDHDGSMAPRGRRRRR